MSLVCIPELFFSCMFDQEYISTLYIIATVKPNFIAHSTASIFKTNRSNEVQVNLGTCINITNSQRRAERESEIVSANNRVFSAFLNMHPAPTNILAAQ